jgi:hypothetical protein
MTTTVADYVSRTRRYLAVLCSNDTHPEGRRMLQYAKKDFTCFAKFDIFHSVFMFLYSISPEGHMTVPWYGGYRYTSFEKDLQTKWSSMSF